MVFNPGPRLASLALAIGLLASTNAFADLQSQIDACLADVAKCSQITVGVPTASTDVEKFRKPNESDDAAMLNRAFMSADVVSLPANHVYNVCSPIVIHSNQTLIGHGGAKIVACGRWNTNNGALDQEIVLKNEHWDGGGTDSNIVITGVAFDGTSLTNPSNGNWHAIGLRHATKVAIENVTCVNIGDCTAFQAVSYGFVKKSTAIGVTNVGFDNWEAPQTTVIMQNNVQCGVNGDGVMFTATDRRKNAITGHDLLSLSNKVQCHDGLVGITANTLSPTANLVNVRSIGDVVDIQNGTASGILFKGNVTGTIESSVVRGINGGSAISVGPEKFKIGGRDVSTQPSNVTVKGADISVQSVSRLNVAAIVAIGKNVRVDNSRLQGGNFPFAVWATNKALISGSNALAPGSFGSVKEQPPAAQ